MHRTMGWTSAASSRLNVAGERQNRPLTRCRPPDDEHHLGQGRSRGQTESLAWVPARTCGRATVSPAVRSGVIIRTGSCGLDTRRYPQSPSQSLANIQAGTIGTENKTPPDRIPGLRKKKKSGSTNEHQRSSRACSHTQKKEIASARQTPHALAVPSTGQPHIPNPNGQSLVYRAKRPAYLAGMAARPRPPPYQQLGSMSVSHSLRRQLSPAPASASNGPATMQPSQTTSLQLLLNGAPTQRTPNNVARVQLHADDRARRYVCNRKGLVLDLGLEAGPLSRCCIHAGGHGVERRRHVLTPQGSGSLKGGGGRRLDDQLRRRRGLRQRGEGLQARSHRGKAGEGGGRIGEEIPQKGRWDRSGRGESSKQARRAWEVSKNGDRHHGLIRRVHGWVG